MISFIPYPFVQLLIDQIITATLYIIVKALILAKATNFSFMKMLWCFIAISFLHMSRCSNNIDMFCHQAYIIIFALAVG